MEDAMLTAVRDAWAGIEPEYPGVLARIAVDGPSRIVARFRGPGGEEAGCVVSRAEFGSSRYPERMVEHDLRRALALLGKAA